jgi:hypothetical protein
VRAALRATPTTRMAPSRSNFPYPAPITASKREEKAVTSGRSDECPAAGDTSPRACGYHLGLPNYRSVRACAVKPCAFGAPLTRLRGLTARHGQTKGIRALMGHLCRLPTWPANVRPFDIGGVAQAHLTECRNERRPDRAATGCTGS